MLRGNAKITQIETFLNQVINEKYMIEHDNNYEDKSAELHGLVKLRRTLMEKLFNLKNKKTTQLTGLTTKTSGKFLEQFVNNDYTISEDEMTNMVDEKHTLMKRLFDAKEKIYYQNTKITAEQTNNKDMRDILEVNINNSSVNLKQKQDAAENDIMSQNKAFQIKENQYRQKNYYIYICKHITSFSILSLLTLLFMKTDHVSLSTTRNLIIAYFIVLIIVLFMNHVYFIRRNAIYFHRYNWRNTKSQPEPVVPKCTV